MQENRSFDEYFGTYTGAEGIPPSVCVPDPANGGCVKPYHDPSDVNRGGPHTAPSARIDIDGGKMDGFVADAEYGHVGCPNPIDPNDPLCGSPEPADVMGYKTGADIPNYWAYARAFVLQDHMFEPNLGWSLPSHLFMVSAWSAVCDQPRDPSTCRSSLKNPDLDRPDQVPDYGWTDLTYLLYKHHVSWRYYVAQGTQPDCDDGAMTCAPQPQTVGTPVWNPLPDFVTPHQDGQLGNIRPASNFFAAARSGHLPAVAWVVPNQTYSEHPTGRVSDGQYWVTSLVNTIMRGPNWKSTAIFVTWDDWAASTITSSRRRWTETGTACACPGS
jgi:phospholipase C